MAPPAGPLEKNTTKNTGLKPQLGGEEATLKLFTRRVVITSQHRFFFAPQAAGTHTHTHVAYN